MQEEEEILQKVTLSSTLHRTQDPTGTEMQTQTKEKQSSLFRPYYHTFILLKMPLEAKHMSRDSRIENELHRATIIITQQSRRNALSQHQHSPAKSYRQTHPFPFPLHPPLRHEPLQPLLNPCHLPKPHLYPYSSIHSSKHEKHQQCPINPIPKDRVRR